MYRSWVIVERRYDLSLRTNAAYESFSRDVAGRGICNFTAFVQAEQKTQRLSVNPVVLRFPTKLKFSI